MDQLLLKLHQVLVQCQILGDQKVKLTGQVVEILSNKTRQLGLDPRNNGTLNNIKNDTFQGLFSPKIKKEKINF